MLKGEPKSIVNFIARYFEVIRELFDIQASEGIIRKESLQAVCGKHDTAIQHQLLEYKIVRLSNDDYEMRDVFYRLFEFVLFEFKPLLPETIEKYNSAITELFRKIKDGVHGDQTILVERLKALSDQVREFAESVEKNTIRLLAETRELKANTDRLTYGEKVQRASFWIDYYIVPLNKILDVNHSESISNKLLDISEYCNQRRLNFDHQATQDLFDHVYFQLRQNNRDLLKQSKLLSSELLPLIQRIKTESLTLSGFIIFLENPYRIPVTRLFKRDKENPYNINMSLNAKEYFEQFKGDQPVFVDPPENHKPTWIFKKSVYKRKLKGKLPVSDFFSWCADSLEQEEITAEKFLAVTTLLFEDDVTPEPSDIRAKTRRIKTSDSIFNVPLLTVK